MVDEDQSKVYNDHNVYILGAGFSAGAGLPLVRDFTNQIRDTASWLEEQKERKGREEEIKAIEQVLKFRLSAASAAFRIPIDIENIEELFSLASAKGGGESNKGFTKSMVLAIASTLDYARSTKPLLNNDQNQCFRVGKLNKKEWVKPPNWRRESPQSVPEDQHVVYSCPDYEFYLGAMCGYFFQGKSDSKNTIITFNYDTVIEDNLHGLGFQVSYGPQSLIGYRENNNFNNPRTPVFKTIKVLKLHGSVNWCNWYDVLKTEASSYESDLAPKSLTDNFESRIGVFENYSSLRDRSLTPLLVPPTWQKLMTGFLPKVWEEAVESLKTATRIIIIGYSIPPTDQHFKYLMAAGLQENISLRKIFFVNNSLSESSDENSTKKLQERLMELFRKEHFNLGIIEKIPLSLQNFLGENSSMEFQTYRNAISRPVFNQTSPPFPWIVIPPSRF